MERLTNEQIEQHLTEVPEWTETNDCIQRTYRLEDFNQALEFINRAAEYAERVQHHPDILVRYNKVTLTLTTHDAEGLTEKDFDFAQAADGFLATVAAGS